MPWRKLTRAERSVVVLLSHGLSKIQIGRRLGITPGAVQVILRRVAKRWGTHSAAGTVGAAYRSGAISGDVESEPPSEPAPTSGGRDPMAAGVWTDLAEAAGFVGEHGVRHLPEHEGDQRY